MRQRGMSEKCSPSECPAATTKENDKWLQYIWPAATINATCPKSDTQDGERLAREVTLHMVVAGETQSPIGVEDMERWLDRQGTEEADEGVRVLGFLREVER